MSALRNIQALILFPVILYGCSGIKHYHSQTTDNVIISNSIIYDGLFSSIATIIKVKKIQPNCAGTDYQGSILLDSDEKEKNIGIPINQPVYIQVSILKRTPSTLSTLGSEETILIPKNGEIYLIDVHYKDKYYEVIFKKKNRGGGTTTFSAVPWAQCRSVLEKV